jgi:hypothetical protein
MQTKEQKRLVALERIERKLIERCETVMENPAQYRTCYGFSTFVQEYINQANDIRLVLGMKTLSISFYDWNRGNLIISDGYSQFYPIEE